MSEPLVLGIESTCDETGVGLVRGTKLLVDRTATSMDEYARYGGIIPEIASRAHLESFLPTLDAAFDEAGVTLADVDAVAVAAGPGLVGSLTVGICAAKVLASSLGKPLYGVNHVIGHLAVDKLAEGPLPDHFIGLVVSGGHSNILEVRNIATDVVELGGTLDDAAGEAFDKVGRLLGLPYPGGPHVDRLSQEGDREAIRFPRGLAAGKDKERHKYDFSFSGLKTAVARYIEGMRDSGEQLRSEDVCAAFSEAVNDSLTAKAVRAALDTGCNTIVVGADSPQIPACVRCLRSERRPSASRCVCLRCVSARITAPRSRLSVRSWWLRACLRRTGISRRIPAWNSRRPTFPHAPERVGLCSAQPLHDGFGDRTPRGVEATCHVRAHADECGADERRSTEAAETRQVGDACRDRAGERSDDPRHG